MGNRYSRDILPVTHSTDVNNVIDFPNSITTSPFDKLTVEIVLAQHRAGTLPEAVLIFLLAGVGLRS